MNASSLSLHRATLDEIETLAINNIWRIQQEQQVASTIDRMVDDPLNRIYLKLRTIEGWTTGAIAEMAGVPTQTVERVLSVDGPTILAAMGLRPARRQ